MRTNRALTKAKVDLESALAIRTELTSNAAE